MANLEAVGRDPSDQRRRAATVDAEGTAEPLPGFGRDVVVEPLPGLIGERADRDDRAVIDDQKASFKLMQYQSFGIGTSCC